MQLLSNGFRRRTTARPPRDITSYGTLLLWLASAAILHGCGGDDTTPSGPPTVAAVSVVVPSATIIAGNTQRLTAIVTAAGGAVLTDRAVTWTSTNLNVATVSTDGILTAVTAGSTLVSAASGGQSGSATITVVPIPVATVTLSSSAANVLVGTTLTLVATLQDAAGATLTGRTIAWTTSNSAVATVDVNGVIAGVAAGDANITATSESKSATATIVVSPPLVATVTVTLTSNAALAGSTILASAVLRDVAGAIVLGRPVAWTTSDVRVATVSTSGLVTAVAPGAVTVIATSENKAGSATLAVTVPPVENVSVSPSAAVLVAGDSQQLIAALRDAGGNALTGRIVVWSSSNSSIATVSATGLVSTSTGGTVVITARSEGRSGSATLSIASNANAPVVSSISPATLVPGAAATISGERFDTASSRNTVSIRGVSAPVVSSTATQITFTVPCVSSGSANVVVAASGLAAPQFMHSVSVTTRTLSVGQSLVLTNNAASLCNELATNSPTARYIVAVFSAATSQNTLVNFEIAGNTAASGSAVPVVAPAVVAIAAGSPEMRENATRDALHWRMLERDRTQYEQSRARAAQLARTNAQSGARFSTSRASLNAVPLPTIGDVRDFFFTFNGGCQDVSATMRTKALYVGTRAIIWEDVANALQSSNDAAYAGFYQRLGQIFDQDQYATIRDNFGDPLVRDALTDADGRVHMVFSSRLNATTAAAYVTSCDQFARTVNAGSNFGEVFYGQVPTVSGSNTGSTNFPDGWFYFMGRTVVHEVKHIASQAARVANNAPTFEQSWLEEGTARHAEEMWVRDYLHKVAWKANTGFGSAGTNGVYCDFQPTNATCNAADPLRRPSYGMRRQFNEIRDKLVSPWDWSPYGDGTGQTGSVFYQTTWSLVRYAIDRYGSSDAAFFKALINSSTNGVTNLTTVAGTSLDQLIGGWGLALFADDYPGLTTINPDLQFQTWNLRAIYAGLNASPNWTTRFPT
ncbi:MAG: Ig-like domain-containing protein, partial [Gemmatimonadaceae bacterium]